MAISVRCTNTECGKVLRVKDGLAGKAVKCPGCGQRTMVPPSDRSARPAESPQVPEPAGHRSAWPWQVATAVALIAGVGVGYLLALTLTKKVDGPRGQTVADDAELRKVRAELQTAQIELAKRAAAPPTAAPLDDSELRQLRLDLQAARAEAAAARNELASRSSSGAPAPASTPSAGGGQQDPANIRGVWKAVEEREFPFDKPITIASYQDKTVFSVLGMTMSYKMDPTKTPKTIDLTSEREGKTYLGIYELNGDLLNIAVHLDGTSRPKDFVLTPQDRENDEKGKSSKWVFLLRRQSR